jgi:hypothetical protein
MELSKYLENQHKKDFAEDVGISVNSLYKYMGGIRLTPLDVAFDIFELTNGKVRPKDLLKTWIDKQNN